jgi:hypothetical protein
VGLLKFSFVEMKGLELKKKCSDSDFRANFGKKPPVLHISNPICLLL